MPAKSLCFVERMVRLRLTVLPVAEADIEPIEQTGIYTFQEAVTGLRTPQFHRQKKAQSSKQSVL